MIYEHEIPKGSRLYFGEIAKLKRDIETKASHILEEFGYEEIVTPFFSYHQFESLSQKEIVRLSDEKNRLLALRADSTIDVVRLVTKRLGRSVEHNRWFYIQPVFRFPSSEIYQVGAEYIGSNDLSEPIEILDKILKSVGLEPYLQISNIKIPRLISKKFGISMSVFEDGNLEAILKEDIEWLSKLARLQRFEDLKSVLKVAPDDIKDELEKIYKICQKIKNKKVLISPLYYAKMKYYDDLYFRFFEGNYTLGVGGTYRWRELEAVGFAGYIDTFLELNSPCQLS